MRRTGSARSTHATRTAPLCRYGAGMEFHDVVQRRRMVRNFTDEPVARPLLDKLLSNATRIPSAGYSQGFAFVVLTDPDQRRMFWRTTSGPDWRGESESESLTRAPVVIIP